MRKIEDKQIEIILQTIYQTNMPVSTFDSLKKLLLELPVIEDPKKVDKK